jgi:hypothetical protein
VNGAYIRVLTERKFFECLLFVFGYIRAPSSVQEKVLFLCLDSCLFVSALEINSIKFKIVKRQKVLYLLYTQSCMIGIIQLITLQ